MLDGCLTYNYSMWRGEGDTDQKSKNKAKRRGVGEKIVHEQKLLDVISMLLEFQRLRLQIDYVPGCSGPTTLKLVAVTRTSSPANVLVSCQ
jgi:hypothetical protein